MANFGLTNERYEQMMNCWNNDQEKIKDIVDEWGADVCNKGYAIFDYEGTGMLGIEASGVVGCFDSDLEATRQAIKDGIKIIPVEELPDNFELKYLGWIDTKANRNNIEMYCKGIVKGDMEKTIKNDIDNVLRQMCFGRSREYCQGVIDRIYKTNVIYDNCIKDRIVADEEIIVPALMEIVYNDYEFLAED